MLPVAFVVSSLAASLSPFDLRSEAAVNPIGLGTAAPRLSWKLSAATKTAKNLRQSGYRISVGSTPNQSDLWDSGLVKSDNTYGITYRGSKLHSGQAAWWRVKVVDQSGRTSAWSAPASFSVGLLKPTDWKAHWIGFDDAPKAPGIADGLDGASWIWAGTSESPFFESTKVIPAGFTKATLRMTADDQFEVRLNGKNVGQSSGNTDAWRSPIDIDVTPAITSGENALWVGAKNTGDGAGLIGKITVRYPNGKTISWVTDGTWQTYQDIEDTRVPARVLGTYGIGPWGKIGRQPLDLPAPRLLRKEFGITKPVKRAIVYGTALGLFEIRLNGRAVGNELFMPGWTDYTKRVYSRGYDVTKALRTGPNALGVILGDGWYSGYVGYGGIRNHYGNKPRAMVQLNVEYTDGTTATIGSSRDWKATTGPIMESDFLMGETYDARNQKPGWDRAGYSAADWKPVATGAQNVGAVEPFTGQPVTRFAKLKAISVTEPTKGAYVLNLGQNIAGFARIKVSGKKGQKITLRFGERLNPDKTLYTANLRGARAIDTYICRGTGVETWEPRFTFHGFQYIEVTGLGHKPKADEVVGIAISSDTPTTGTIATSSPLINKLVSNAWWTQRMNFIDIPTDCPQRDERLGWTGDAQAYVRTASMLTDVQPFFTKWLVTLDDGQRADGQFPMVAPVKVAGDDGGPAWADAGVICPWTIYDTYGDTDLLVQHYPQMRKFVDFCVARSTPDLLPPAQFHCFGDWLNINSNTPNEVIYTAYFAGSARIVSQAAAKLGNSADAKKYEELYQRVRSAFQKTYVSVDGVVSGDSQCAYVLALQFDLLDKAGAQVAAKRLVADIEKRGWHLSTGFVGTRDIMKVLSKIGRNDVAFRLLHNTTFPSWGFTIVNGATSIWERWDGWTPEKGFQDIGMNSFAHYAFGAVVGWMFDQPAGISNLEPGFGHVKIAPQIDPKMTWLKSSYDSVRGKIVSEWRADGKKVTMRVVIPPNVRATVVIPGGGTREVGSGEYTFTGSRVLPESKS